MRTYDIIDRGAASVRSGPGGLRHLCDVVDPGHDPGVHPSILVPCEGAASATQKKLFFKLRQAKNAISTFQDGDLRPDQAALIAERLKVAERDVVDMNRRLRGDRVVECTGPQRRG